MSAASPSSSSSSSSSSWFAQAEIFSAFAYAVDGTDPDLQKGTHLRIFAGLGPSFPLTPFAVFKLASRETEPRAVHVTDKSGHVVSGGLQLSQIGLGDATLVLSDSNTRRTVRVELVPVAGEIKGAQLLDQRNRVVAERDVEKWMFSAPIVHKVRVWGSAEYVQVKTRAVDMIDIIGPNVSLQAIKILGFPVTGTHSWYIGLQDRSEGLDRVLIGAPMRINPMDRPDGPFDSLGGDEEVARVEAMLKSSTLAGGIEKLLLNMVDDSSMPPWSQTEKEEMLSEEGEGEASKQTTTVPRLGNLQVAAFDPGLARFLGFAARFDELPDLDGYGSWDTLAIAGLFAIDLEALEKTNPVAAKQLSVKNADQDKLIERLALALEESSSSGTDVKLKIKEMIEAVEARRLAVRALVTVISPVPPWLAPSLQYPQVFQTEWQSATDNTPSSRYRASFAFSEAPPGALAAVATKLDGSGWTSRHDSVAVPGFEPPERAKPRILGHEKEVRSRLNKLHISGGTFKHSGLISDQNIPFIGDAAAFRVSVSDFFGRFGKAVEFQVEPPPRPAPPPPVLRFHLDHNPVDLTSLDPQSPGDLKVTVAVPNQDEPLEPFDTWAERAFGPEEKDRLASAIVVPRIDDLPAGSMQLNWLNIMVGAESKNIDVSTPGLQEIEFHLPELGPQKSQELALSAVFLNTENIQSPEAKSSVKIVDPRPPPAYSTGIGLFWTSPPGPSKEVELKLKWTATAKSLHRVYLTDQHGLKLALGELVEPVPQAEPSRARVAQVGCKKILDHEPVNQKAFRLLTDKPVEAGTDNLAVYTTTLPRSLETVQFLRVVPLSEEGAETPFEKCGVVPVAVPDSRRPPSPKIIDAKVDTMTGTAKFKVIAEGFDLVHLERDEPGLFTQGKPGDHPPQLRIRRAVGPVVDPIYARTIFEGPLTVERKVVQDAENITHTETVISFVVTDDNNGKGLKPFVRYVYWAEVRLPPERRIPAGVTPLDPIDGVSAVDSVSRSDYPRPLSLPSAPHTLMHSRSGNPNAPSAGDINITRTPPDGLGNIEIVIELANPPQVHPKAIGPYRLAIWYQWPGLDIEPVKTANGVGLDGKWPELTEGLVSATVILPSPALPSTTSLDLRLAIVDPLGRMSSITAITVP